MWLSSCRVAISSWQIGPITALRLLYYNSLPAYMQAFLAVVVFLVRKWGTSF